MCDEPRENRAIWICLDLLEEEKKNYRTHSFL